MLIKKSDIGGEIISILTRGMYLDPKDALREYVQNGVDAGATSISIRIRQDTIVVIDNGTGMDKTCMRSALRVGISDKNLSQSVGFMGIGIYSSFHLCDELNIYSKSKGESPNILTFKFKEMRGELEKQRELRYTAHFDTKKLIALQDLLEKNIFLEELKNDDFPKIGTRVEMIGIEPTFFQTLTKFNEVSEYLEKVIPLPFSPKFTYGKEIQNNIQQICKNNNHNFSLVNLELQINEEKKTLYRPYVDDFFEPSPLPPKFITLKSKSEFFGIAWGCLNSSKNSIKNLNRGFIIKKHGFSIGNREDLLTYFVRQIYYNRYIGEIIVVHPKLLPNASRSEFEYSPLRIDFQNILKQMAIEYNQYADTYQEELKASEKLDEAIRFLKESRSQYEFYLDNLDHLLILFWNSKEFSKTIKTRKSKNRYNGSDLQRADEVIKQLDALAKEIKEIIEQKKNKSKKSAAHKSESEIASDVSLIPEESDSSSIQEFDSLLQLIESLGLELNKELKALFELIDENYIRVSSDDKDDYINKLLKLKNDFEEMIEE